MSTDNFYTVSPRKASKMIKRAMYAGLTPFVKSSPGIGKSSIAHALAKEENLAVIDHRLSTSAPEDLTGLPQFKDGFARFAPFRELFPLEDAPLPKDADGKEMNGWLLFLDEFNHASKAVQAAAYKLILDRKVGQHRLHPNVVMLCAGNKATDRAFTNNLSTATQSRLVHINMIHSFPEWLEDVALVQGYDSRIIAYLSQYPEKLMDFRPEHDGDTYCCPRTWEFVDRMYNGLPIDEEDTALIGGTITHGVATSFVAYQSIYKKLVPFDEIIQDPSYCRLPDEDDLGIIWATVTNMMEKTDIKNFGKLVKYADRLDQSYRLLFYRGALTRDPEIQKTPEGRKAVVAIGKYLNA